MTKKIIQELIACLDEANILLAYYAGPHRDDVTQWNAKYASLVARARETPTVKHRDNADTATWTPEQEAGAIRALVEALGPPE